MDVSELVRSVVREVLQEIMQEQDKMKQDSARPCVLILCGRDEHPAALLQEKLGNGVRLLFHGEAHHSETQSPCRIVLPFLSCPDMAALANGQAQGKAAEVLKLLLQGKEVEVLDFEYKRYMETAPGPLLCLYEAHEKTLASFGLKAFQPKRPEAIRFRDDLVTARTVEQAGAEGASTLLVPVTAKVTPLAAEAAKNLKIAIEKRL